MINYSQEFMKVAEGSMFIISEEGGALKLILEFQFQPRKKMSESILRNCLSNDEMCRP